LPSHYAPIRSAIPKIEAFFERVSLTLETENSGILEPLAIAGVLVGVLIGGRTV
jgi:hypothetical protein